MAERQPSLLLDENIAARLVEALADRYPGSLHVAHLGLAAAPDRAIWEYARDHNLVLVSKDQDFLRFSVLYGPPPKVIWLRLGNCSTDEIIQLLNRRQSEIESFITDAEAGFLAIG